MAALWLIILLSMVAVGMGADGRTSEGGEQNQEGQTDKKENVKTGGEKNGKKVPLAAQCCQAELVMPTAFFEGSEKCYESLQQTDDVAEEGVSAAKGGVAVKDSVVDGEKGKVEGGESGAVNEKGTADGAQSEVSNGCMDKCMMKENGLLNETNFIKEPELRQKLLNGTVDEEARNNINAAIVKCLALLKKLGEQEQAGEKSLTCKRAEDLFGCITKNILKNCPEKFWRTDVSFCNEGRTKKTDVPASINEKF